MTGYHITLGYMSNRNDGANREVWQEVVRLALNICDSPELIASEAVALGMSPATAREYAQAYKERFDSTIRFKEADGDSPAQIMQLAGGAGPSRSIKEAMRRAFCRLLMHECHKREIEINVNVA